MRRRDGGTSAVDQIGAVSAAQCRAPRPDSSLKTRRAKVPAGTLCDFGVATEVSGDERFDEMIVRECDDGESVGELYRRGPFRPNVIVILLWTSDSPRGPA